MGETFHNNFNNEHEIVFYEGTSNHRNGKKMPLTIRNDEILKENITSPEFNLFHMPSPDLEQLIVGNGSNAETSLPRETTTINSSDLNVLNLVSPDFEKILANFNDSGRSIEKQHEVYTKTFVDALHKMQGEDNKKITTSAGKDYENKNYQDLQFVRQKSRDVEYSSVRRDVKIQDNNMNKLESNFCNYGLPSLEDKNKNRIEINEHRNGSHKTTNIELTFRREENKNLATTHYDQQDLTRYSTGLYSHVEDNNRNKVQARYCNPINRNPDHSNPNINPGNRSNPSEINLESHPELFKLHAHAKLSDNVRNSEDQVPPGPQNVHTTPQMFPLPPIDLQVQEIVKRERKKQKNRVAASKCRKKKLEREAQLEIKVQQLRERNIELSTLAGALKNQLSDLKQHVMEHIACGCHVTAY